MTAMRPPGSSVRDALGEHVAEHLQVVEVGGGDVALAERLLVRLAGEVRRRGDHESDRVVGDVAHVAGVAEEHLVDRLGSATLSCSEMTGGSKRA